jgi:cardiolipin synthase
VVCDDQVATVGTINFDFRSLYLHFECGVLLNGTSCVKYVKQDALDTLAISREIKLEDCTNSVIGRLMHQLLRILAPLL